MASSANHTYTLAKVRNAKIEAFDLTGPKMLTLYCAYPDTGTQAQALDISRLATDNTF